MGGYLIGKGKGKGDGKDADVQVDNSFKVADGKDINVACQDCSISFVFTVSEQQFFHEKGMRDKPKRCKNCLWERKQAIAARSGGRSDKSKGGGKNKGKSKLYPS